MEVKEELVKTELEDFVPVEDLVAYRNDYGFEFPVRNGHLLNYFSCEGLSILGDRQ